MAEVKKKDLYTFKTWAKKPDGTWVELDSESIFKDFEPYHCGIPAITEGFTDFEFDPEKCNEENNFQAFIANGYTNEILTNKTANKINYNYKNGTNIIKGCERGTVILANHPNHDTFIAQGSEDVTIRLIGTEILDIIKTGASPQRFNKAYFDAKGLAFPKRLGIMLVGAGGGAGGGTWYDNKKDGKSDDIVYCSGGSGGGGCIVWGVIDIEKLKTVTIKTHNPRKWLTDLVKADSAISSSLKLHFGTNDFENKEITDEQLEGVMLWLAEISDNTIMPSHGGKNANTAGLTHDKPKKGGNGLPGYDTILYYDDIAIATAQGGGGGKAGHWENTAGGGYGGGASCNDIYFKAAKQLTGLPGISTQKAMEATSIPSRSFMLDFLLDTTNDNSYSYKIGPIDAQQAILTVDTSARIPGGHSLGTGAYQDTIAGIGGGGCSNGANGSNNGGEGYWIIFYA